MDKRTFTMKRPEEAFKDLYRNFKPAYSYSEDMTTWYRGFDISSLSVDYPIAEAIIVSGIVSQIRLLREKPYIRISDVQIGGF